MTAIIFSSQKCQCWHIDFFSVKVIGDIDIWQSEWTDETYQHFAVDKMKFAKVRDENGKLISDKTRIIYNGHITIENIPLKAYEYIVNGKSAIDWIMNATPSPSIRHPKSRMTLMIGQENTSSPVISLIYFYLSLCYLAKQ